jgi:hypothetical protein
MSPTQGEDGLGSIVKDSSESAVDTLVRGRNPVNNDTCVDTFLGPADDTTSSLANTNDKRNAMTAVKSDSSDGAVRGGHPVNNREKGGGHPENN